MTSPGTPTATAYKPHMLRLSSAAIAREHGWTAGTVLTGTDGADTVQLLIVDIAFAHVLADDGNGVRPYDLRYRSWRAA